MSRPVNVGTRLARYVALLKGVAGSRDMLDLALKIIPILSKLGLAFPVAVLIRISIKRLSGNKRSKYRILSIQKAVFNEDVREVFRDAPDFAVFGVPRALIKSMALAFLPREICEDSRYLNGDAAVQVAKTQYRYFCGRLWKHLTRLGGYQAVVTGNWCYWAERELAGALEAQGVPFVVMHKEGIKPPALSKILSKEFRETRGAFSGRRILVYQDTERLHQLEAGTAKAGQIRVVGIPRLDGLHEWRRKAAEGRSAPYSAQPTLLYLAFLESKLLPQLFGLPSDLAWRELARGATGALFNVARARPHADIIVRPREQDVSGVLDLLAQNGDIPANIRVHASGEIRSLLEATHVVCGFNTTVLFEALAMGKPLVVPWFGEATDPRYTGFIVDPGAATHKPTSPREMQDILLRYLDNPAPIPAVISESAKMALSHWMGNDDGKAAHRVLAAMRAELAVTTSSTRLIRNTTQHND